LQTKILQHVKEIRNAVPKEALLAELTPDKLMRYTNYGHNPIYIFTAHNSPMLMQEVGRLREIAFRKAGGGTGEDIDIDEYDTAEIPYQQLIVWDNECQEILGGYRYINLNEVPADKLPGMKLATQGLLKFTEKFNQEFLPYTIELGRSFVQPNYQAANAGRKTLFALDNLWDGLGALIVKNPNVKYFFGKVTMYTHYNKYARDLILYFLNKHFPDPDKLVYPTEPLPYFTDIEALKIVLNSSDYTEDYKILSKQVRENNEVIPPLVNSYMNLSPTMRFFGTATNHHFGGVEESGILITINDIYPSKKHRHLEF